MGEPGDVLRFWFGANQDDEAIAKEKSELWWKADPAVDAEIRARFGDLVEAAARNGLSAWADSPFSLLALILVTDQFPRNIHRGTPAAFAQDAAARAYCKHGIARGFDLQLRPIERVFHYLPLEHSESPEDQDESVRLFSELLDGAPAAQKALFEGYLRYAQRHREIIVRFGRFCHRNRILGRTSTSQEIEFLKQPGSSF